jgi:NAD(P)-dependent dehydrogenase (short-subunit alcohol dehydrogenase family)
MAPELETEALSNQKKGRRPGPSTLITGANRGLGLKFARQYLTDGWQLYAASRKPQSASELRRLAGASDDKLQILALDVTEAVSVQAAAAKLDGQAIDLLLNNAGVGGPRGQTVGNMRRCSRSTPWGPCAFLKHSLTTWHEANANLSSPLPAAWDRLLTTLQEARSPIGAQKPR